jgi:hypothetical protein
MAGLPGFPAFPPFLLGSCFSWFWMCARTRTHTSGHTHTRARARTHTHTHTHTPPLATYTELIPQLLKINSTLLTFKMGASNNTHCHRVIENAVHAHVKMLCSSSVSSSKMKKNKRKPTLPFWEEIVKEFWWDDGWGTSRRKRTPS